MDIHTLYYFLKAAQLQSFTKASRECFISQTAMSLAMSRLEEEMGMKLFERKGKVLQLTTDGLDFYDWVAETVQAYERLLGKKGKDASPGVLSIGFANCIDALWLLSYMQSFRNQHEKLKVEQRLLSIRTLLDQLKAGAIDAAFLPPYLCENTAGIHMTVVSTFPMVLVVHADNPSVPLSGITKEQLRMFECHILTYADHKFTEDTFTRNMAWEGIHFASLHQHEHIEEILLNVMSNPTTVAFLPSLVTDHLYGGLRAIPILNCQMNLPFVLCALGGNDNPMLEAFLKSI